MIKPIPIHIDPAENSVTFGDGHAHKFRRAWAATMLALLATQAMANQELDAATFECELLKKGWSKPLSRALLSRLVDTLNEVFKRTPDCPIRLESLRPTAGPWRLKLLRNVKFSIEGSTDSHENASPGAEKLAWSWPLLLTVSDTDMLRQLLVICRNADEKAMHGGFIDAIELLQEAYTYPLSIDTRTMLLLREALFHKRIGEFDDARTRVKQAIASAELGLRDGGLLSSAKFLLGRIDYDESPADVFQRLAQFGPEPAPLFAVDIRTAPHWQNLRGLLARRALLEASKNADADRTQIEGLHQSALLHLETAMYFALALKDFDLLQAIAANLTLHLQSVIALDLADVEQVYAWHILVMSYTNKLDVGKDSAWEFIFLGEFWLDNQEVLKKPRKGAKSAYIGYALPSEEKFYVDCIKRLDECADARQVGIARLNYLRFARDYLSQTKLAAATKAFNVLLGNTEGLREVLISEGYGPHLP